MRQREQSSFYPFGPGAGAVVRGNMALQMINNSSYGSVIY